MELAAAQLLASQRREEARVARGVGGRDRGPMGLGRAERERTGDEHDHGCGCGRSPRRAVGAPPGRRRERAGVVPLLVERAQDAVPKVGWWLLIVHRAGERGDPVLELHPLLATGAAPPEVPADLEVLGTLEGAEQALREQLADLVTRHGRLPSPSRRAGGAARRG